MSSPAAFAKMYAASDTQLILGVPAKPPALRGKEEQRRERARIFVKKSEQAIQSLLRRGGEGGIRTLETVLAVYTISSRAPSTRLGDFSIS